MIALSHDERNLRMTLAEQLIDKALIDEAKSVKLVPKDSTGTLKIIKNNDGTVSVEVSGTGVTLSKAEAAKAGNSLTSYSK